MSGKEKTSAIAGKTILLIEDEDIVRVLVRRLLEENGFTILDAATLARAREIWRTAGQSIDLLFADVQLPDGSVKELCREFLQDKPGLRVIFTSGYSEDVIQDTKCDVPCSAFIQKPFNPRELLNAIREVFEITK
ncbi:MAG: response regulator [Verrucomicrobiales bacterium]|nr:response regulator [Verrucomicrobiales bacterium]